MNETAMPSGEPGRADEIRTAAGEDPPAPLLGLLAHARRVGYDESDVLYHQESASDTVFFVVSGLLKLIANLPNGRARIVRLHRPGSVLGLSGLLGQHNEHSAITITPVTTLQLPLGHLERLRADEPASYVKLVEHWHRYLNEADTWITDFSTGPIRGRVARLVKYLSDFEPEAAQGEVRLLTCDEMASILGVTTESVSRTLAEFKRRDILMDKRDPSSELYRTDVAKLDDIAGQE
jgi:CRP-like cAMP-binding protein